MDTITAIFPYTIPIITMGGVSLACYLIALLSERKDPED